MACGGLPDGRRDPLGVAHEADVPALRSVAQGQRAVAEEAPEEAVTDARPSGCRPASRVCLARRTAPRGAMRYTRRVVSSKRVRSHCHTARVKRRAARAATASTIRSSATRTACGADELGEQRHGDGRGQQQAEAAHERAEQRRRVRPPGQQQLLIRLEIRARARHTDNGLRRPAPASCPPAIMRTLVRSPGRC